MKRVLVISYYWPPSGGSGVQRWVKMCKYLSSFGWQSVVYTPSNPALTSIDTTLAEDVPADVEIITCPIVEPGQFAKKTTSAQVTPINGQKKSIKQKVMMWARGNFFIPDPRIMWLRPSISFLKEYLEGHPVDAIVSTGPPHSMHLIARRIAREFSIPWVADFRDPWTKMFYFKHLELTSWAERKHQSLEKQVLDECSTVVAVSPFVAAEFMEMTTTPVALITNGYDEDDFDAAATPDYSGFTLLHAGLFASDGNPEVMWRALKTALDNNSSVADDFTLELCGKTDQAIIDSIKAAGLGRYLKNDGYLDHREVVKKMQSAASLMLPLRKEPEYKATLPGKLFEYLASRRPIIGVGQKDGAMAAIIAKTAAGDVFDWNDEEQMVRWFTEKFRLFEEGKLENNKSDISEYSRKCLAGAYAVLLDSLVDKKP